MPPTTKFVPFGMKSGKKSPKSTQNRRETIMPCLIRIYALLRSIMGLIMAPLLPLLPFDETFK